MPADAEALDNVISAMVVGVACYRECPRCKRKRQPRVFAFSDNAVETMMRILALVTASCCKRN